MEVGVGLQFSDTLDTCMFFTRGREKVLVEGEVGPKGAGYTGARGFGTPYRGVTLLGPLSHPGQLSL